MITNEIQSSWIDDKLPRTFWVTPVHNIYIYKLDMFRRERIKWLYTVTLYDFDALIATPYIIIILSLAHAYFII